MRRWQKVLYKLGHPAETYFDKLKLKLRQRLGLNTNVQVVPYMTYCNSKHLHLRGRVMVNKNIEINDNDSLWKNLENTYKRFASLEIADARLKLIFSNTTHEFESDKDGYFEIAVPLNAELPGEELWHHPLIELVESPVPFEKPLHVRAEVMTPPSTARFGVISDIDDTILVTEAQYLLKSLYLTFLRNAHSRLPFEGVSAFYQALQKGVSGAENNPIFYVSSSPWNLYDFLIDFLEINEIPKGPVFLKDYGFTHDKFITEAHALHKPKHIRNILNAYPHLNFILIGDSGQHDPEIYSSIIKEFSGRILASYIRDVSLDERDMEVMTIAKELAGHQVEMILAENSYTAATHAADKGYISKDALPLIKAQKKTDERAIAVERVIEEELDDAKEN